MCMQIGTITAISIATAILAGSQNPGAVQAWIYIGGAVAARGGSTFDHPHPRAPRVVVTELGSFEQPQRNALKVPHRALRL